jgi:glycerophosphoryl diester phosphodiesterase
MEALISLGVDGMFTNFPDRLEAVLGKEAAGGKSGAKLAAEASRACREG